MGKRCYQIILNDEASEALAKASRKRNPLAEGANPADCEGLAGRQGEFEDLLRRGR